MKRLLPLLMLLAIAAPTPAPADGCPPSTCGITSSAIPGSPLLYVRSLFGPLHAYDLERGTRLFKLPTGSLSADGRTFVASARTSSGRTTVARIDARTGMPQRVWSLPGPWDVGGITADGRRIALARHTRRATIFRVGSKRRVLRGWRDVEALSPDGRRLYLVHWGRSSYVLEQLDLVSGRLAPTRLADPDEKMIGLPSIAVATRDGLWLFTLYWKGQGEENFIHALDLRNGVAHCIDLPLDGDYFSVATSSIALSPDEQTLYLASPYLGRVTIVDVNRLKVRRVVRFRGLPASSMNMTVGPSAAVTPDGRMLAFSGGRSVWRYDTAYGIVKPPVRVGSAIRGLGFRPDGARLMVLPRHGAAVFIDAAG